MMKNIIEVLKRLKYYLLILFIIVSINTYYIEGGIYPSFGYPFYYLLIDLFTYIFDTIISLLIPLFIGLIVFVRTKNIDKTISYMTPIIIIIMILLIISTLSNFI